MLVGYGGGQVGLNAIKAGRRYGTVMQRPKTKGKLGMQCAVAAVKTRKRCGGIDVLKNLPQGGGSDEGQRLEVQGGVARVGRRQ